MSAARTDARRMWALARDLGTAGLHSHDARRHGISGNPSQRAKDIADHVPFWTKRESRNGRPGSRYFVDGTQPDDATAVRPNREAELSGEGAPPTRQGAAELGLANEVHHYAGGHWSRDYTDPAGEWKQAA